MDNQFSYRKSLWTRLKDMTHGFEKVTWNIIFVFVKKYNLKITGLLRYENPEVLEVSILYVPFDCEALRSIFMLRQLA